MSGTSGVTRAERQRDPYLPHRVKSSTKADLRALEDLAKTIRDVRTELLKAFYSFGESTPHG